MADKKKVRKTMVARVRKEMSKPLLAKSVREAMKRIQSRREKFTD